MFAIDTRYIIKYGNKISVKDTKTGQTKVFPYGIINTKQFGNFRKTLKTAGMSEYTEFYPMNKIEQGCASLPLKGSKPRGYQEQIVELFSKETRFAGILKSPTGSGKGSIVAYLIAKKNISTIVIVPTSDLVHQTAERIRTLIDIDPRKVGELGDGKKEIGTKILVTTWQAFNSRKNLNAVNNAGYNMLICDEVHKASADVLSSVISSLSCKFKFGMSATTYKTRESQMEKIESVIGKVICEVDTEMLYEEGYLLRPSIIKYETGVTCSIESGIASYFLDKLAHNQKMRYAVTANLFNNYKRLAPENRTRDDIVNAPEDMEWKLLARIAAKEYIDRVEAEGGGSFAKKLGLAKSGLDLHPDKEKSSISICKKLFSKHREKGIVLFNTKEAGRRLARSLMEEGYANIYLLNGDSPNKSIILRSLSSGEIDNYIVISTVSLLSEGNDIPSLERGYLGSPVYPPFADIERLHQIIGRTVRPDQNNTSKRPVFVLAHDMPDGWIREKREESLLKVIQNFNPQILEWETYINPQGPQKELTSPD